FAENEITAALDFVTHDVLPVVYELSGHGETSLSSTQYGTLLADENVELKTLELLKGETVSVPEDCEALIITSPQTDISKEESDAIIKYLEGGGQVMFVSYIAYYTAESMPNMAAVCSHMGLKAVEEIIIESDTTGYSQLPYYLVPKVTGNGITAGLDSSLYLFMVESHAITAVADKENVNILPLLETTEGAYFYNEENVNAPDKADKDKFTLAYQSTITGADGKEGGTLYWFATLAFLDNAFYNYGNSKLFSKIVVETCDKPTSVSIIGKELSTTYLSLTEMISDLGSITVCAIIPLAALAIGFGIWLKRRRR
ncbi:MAG: Gldg family protein, partial [Clostridia bacterium]|nr:Gldg family protein [Clostridia bacterium]